MAKPAPSMGCTPVLETLRIRWLGLMLGVGARVTLADGAAEQ